VLPLLCPSSSSVPHPQPRNPNPSPPATATASALGGGGSGVDYNGTQTGVLCAGCEDEGKSGREIGAGDDGWRLTMAMAGRVPAVQIELASSRSHGHRGAEHDIA